TVSGSACANVDIVDSARRSTRFSRAKRMSSSGATYSFTDANLREAGSGNVHAGAEEPARSQFTALVRIEALAGEDVEAPTVLVAEHARDGEPVGGDPIEDLATLTNTDALPGA